MRYTYDDEADALYVLVDEEAEVARSEVVDERHTVDLASDGRVAGIEVLGASLGVDLSALLERYDLSRLAPHAAALRETRFRPAIPA